MVQLAKIKGAAKVISIDLVEEKFKIAEKLSVDFTLNPLNKYFLSDFKSITSGGANVVIECAGNQSAVKLAFELVKPGGRIVLFGLSDKSAEVSFNLQSFFHKELTVKGSLLNAFTFQTAVDLLTSSKIKVDLLNPTKMQLTENDINKIFKTKKSDDVIKYMVFPNN